jgi:putative ABC transport system ATP-binding protein
MPQPKYIVEAQNIEKSYGSTPAHRGASVGVRPGEILAIMGPSGSGKSTLMHCMAGIYKPDSGKVLLGGKDLFSFSDTQRTVLRRTDFGFVFQFGQLVPELSAIDNIALPLILGGKKRAAAHAVARQWFAKLGIDGLENRASGELSGGQAQRVAIARALITGPKVIFADEPTGSLDSLASEQVMELMTALARENNTAVVVVTHEPRTAAYADREIVVRDGKIATSAEALA